MPPAVAVGLLLAAALVHTVGEVWHANGSTALAYDLARPDAVGEYQGAHQLVDGVAQALGRFVLTVLLLDGGRAGWAVLGVAFVVVALLAPPLVTWAAANRATTVGDRG